MGSMAKAFELLPLLYCDEFVNAFFYFGMEAV